MRLGRVLGGALLACSLVIPEQIAAQGELLLQLPSGLDVREMQPLSVPLGATGGIDSNYAFSLADPTLSGVQINDSRLVWTPGYGVATAEQPDVLVRIPVRVINQSGQSGRGDLLVRVRHVNQPPVVDQVATAWVQPNREFNRPVGATDPDDVRLTYSKVDNTPDPWPPTAVLTADGRFVWTPTALDLQQTPNRSLGFDVVDPAGARTRGTIAVRLQPIDAQPVIDIDVAAGAVDEGTPYKLVFRVTEPNGQAVRVSLRSDVEDIGIAQPVRTGESYAFEWTPTREFVAPPNRTRTVSFTITAEDGTTEPRTHLQALVVRNSDGQCALFSDYKSELERSVSLLMQIDSRTRSLDRTMWKRDAANLLRNLITAFAGGWTGKELTEGDNGAGGLAGGATAAWLALSDKIPGLASADEARAQRLALKTSYTELLGIATSYASDFREPQNRMLPTFQERSLRLQETIGETVARHREHSLPAEVAVQSADFSRLLYVTPQAPNGCS